MCFCYLSQIENNDEKSKIICESCKFSVSTWLNVKNRLKASFVFKSPDNELVSVLIFVFNNFL